MTVFPTTLGANKTSNTQTPSNIHANNSISLLLYLLEGMGRTSLLNLSDNPIPYIVPASRFRSSLHTLSVAGNLAGGLIRESNELPVRTLTSHQQALARLLLPAIKPINYFIDWTPAILLRCVPTLLRVLYSA